MANKKKSRTWMMLGAGILLAAALTYAFWPRPLSVDMGTAVRAPMTVTLDEDAKTQVRNAYVVSAPITGQLLRVDVEPGDAVEGGKSVIARMLPSNPSALDIRTREQGMAAVSAAEAALRMAKADRNKAVADKDLADTGLKRTRQLRAKQMVAQIELDQAEQAARAASAALDMTQAAIAMREADLANSRASLISFSDNKASSSVQPPASSNALPLTAPVSGRILQVMQKSATTLAAGTPILEIGDIANDLEVTADMLSTDAIKVAAGQRVLIDNWGGEYPLNGVIARVEPWGFTKFSALGVEEQRVKVIITLSDPLERRQKLGHGFRVEIQIIAWEDPDALTIPSSALFRDAGNWAVFTVEAGQARLHPVEVGQNNGVQAQIIKGVEAGNSVILYPSPGLVDGAAVALRAVGG